MNNDRLSAGRANATWLDHDKSSMSANRRSDGSQTVAKEQKEKGLQANGM